MHRILVASVEQEISSFNPVLSSYSDFAVLHGEALRTEHAGKSTSIRGALDVFARHGGVEAIPTYAATAYSAGPLEQAGFERIASEFLAALKPHAGKVQGAYFSLHGAMGCSDGQGGGEKDPEGYLLAQARKVLGEDLPIVISLDLHGILTERMLRHSTGVVTYHTYPHVDFQDTGERAAKMLLRILDEGLKPVVARVTVPALVRGDELITATGCYGEQIRYAQALQQQKEVLGAGFMIGNPFTDVPELCSQAIVVTDGDEALARENALKMAQDFWTNRERMQARLVSIDEAVAGAKQAKGPVMFTDAADATSSGASGDSNAIIAALIERGYEGTVLAPIVDAPVVQRAMEKGIGATFRAPVGGSLDTRRFTPIELELTVEMLSRGQWALEGWGVPQDGGPCAVLTSGKLTLLAMSRPAFLFDRSPFYAHGLDPQRFDAVVVKSPHCQHDMFEAWCERNFNVDTPGSTSANLPTLGHTVCARPVFPLDEGVTFAPKAQIFRRG